MSTNDETVDEARTRIRAELEGREKPGFAFTKFGKGAQGVERTNLLLIDILVELRLQNDRRGESPR